MKILIAGGGTGGHVYPALTIADAIKKLKSEHQIEFVGTSRGLENKLVPAAGYKLHRIDIGRLNKNVSLRERIFTLLSLPVSLCKALLLLWRYRPEVILGVGGYASAPVVFAATLCARRVYIWEPNAFPGLANRWLSPFVSECLVVFDEAKKHLHNKKIRRVPMPVRESIEHVSLKTTQSDQFQVLIFGGSQGAQAINRAVLKAVSHSPNWLEGIQIIHQVGVSDYEFMKSEYEKIPWANRHLECVPYIHDMPKHYAMADLVISRSGTGTISEISACGKAAILIPLPSAADDHQMKNARALEMKGGARLLPQYELTTERLINEIVLLKNNVIVRSALESEIKKFHEPRGAELIARIITGEN